MPQNPVKDGHTFNGWFWDKDVWTYSFDGNSLLNLQLTADLHVYAYFIPNNRVDGSLGLEYTFDEASDGYIVKGIGSCVDTEIIIPTTYNSKPVIGIAESAFAGCFRVTKITIQNSVKFIDDDAFYNCINLNSLVLPDGIDTLGTDILFNTPLFNNSVYWEDGVLYIGNYLVSAKASLVGDYTVKEGTVAILDYAFANCSLLKNVFIPNSVTYLGKYAFNNCINLGQVTLSSNITAINAYTFSGCEQLKSINIPNGVVSIGNYAFSNCSALTNVTIPDSVQEIHKYAFNKCDNINYEIVDGNLKYIGNWLFGVVDDTLTSANLKETTIGIFYEAFEYCDELTSIVIPNSVKSIGDYAFYSCDNLATVTLSNNLLYIGEYAFDSCESLTSITLPKSLISIGNDAFDSCDSLTAVYYTGSIAEWCNILFDYNDANPLRNNADLYINGTKVVELTIPNGITKINDYAFAGCTSITSIILPNSVTSIGENAFSYCYNLTEVIMSNNLVEIGEYAFYQCKALMSITIPQSVETIGYDAFYYCEKLIAVRNYSDLDIVAGDSDYGYVGYYADTIFTTADIDKEIFFTSGDFVFYKNGDNEYFLVGYNGTSATVVLPNTINGEAYSIFSYAFSGASHVTSIIVPQTVKSIQKGAFYGCESLESITLPFIGETAKALDETYQYPLGYIFGTSSFNNSVSARQYYRGSSATSTTNTTYYLPASLKTVIITGDTINYGAFYNCTNLETINIANAINIDGSIFYGCSKLTSVTFSNSLEKITASMFDSCTSLETITIPNSVTEIGNWAFDSCSALKSITIPSNVVSIGDSAFYNCGALESVTILGNLDKIGSSAFYNCEKLSSISLPSTITQIGQNAFYNTAYYNTADNWVDNVLYIGSYLISAKTDLVVGEYSIKAGTTAIASYAFYNCSGITKITIPTSVTAIGNYAFYGCNQMSNINLDSNIKSIGSYAFYGCTALTEMAIPSSVTAIAERTFYNCTGLTSITIPSSVTTIGNYAFYNCTALTTINYNAANCADLSSYNYVFYKAGQSGDGVTVNIGTTVNHIPSYLFYPGSSSYAPKIIALNFVETSSCKTIGKYAFGYCATIESITFPASLESIAEYAFYYCTGLTSVEYLGTGVTVDSNAFSGCNIETADTTEQYENGIYSGTTLIGVVDKTVTTLVIRDGTTAIADNALSGYTSLTSITIPNSVTAIGYRAFYNCKGLTSITLPKSVIEIESNAFENCSALTGVYYEGTLTEWCNISFGGIKANPLYYGKKLYINNTEVTSLVIPNDVTTISSYAFVNCTSITSIVVPNTVTTIGLGAFSGCSSLQSITLPFIGGSLKELTDTWQYPFGYIFGSTSYTGGYSAYQSHRGNSPTGTTGTTYYIPSSLTTVVITGGQIVAGAFDDCKNLTSITLPNTATMIDIYAFSGCTGLTDILIPESITKIADDAFYSCSNLKNVHITSLEKWCAIEFYTYRYSSSIDCSNPLRYGGNLYVNGVLVTDLVIPSTVNSIAAGAFYGCTSITSVTIPSTVTEIGMLAFTNCTNMQTVTVNGGITELPVSVFQGCSGLKTVNLPASITKINDYAFSGCSALSKVNYTGTISDWCNIKFTSTTSNPLTNAKKLYLNNTLVSELVIPEGVTTINAYAFKGCTSITSVTIPNSVKTIETYAFADCNGIRTVVFGSGIQSIGAYAFNGCSSLSKVYYIGSVDSWINVEMGTNASPLQYNAALYINGELIENVLVIPQGTTEIPAYAFAGNKYITKVIIPSSVTTIGEGAFKNCINLSEIELPDQTKYIYADAFYNTAYYNNIANWIDGNVLYIGNALIKVKTSTTGILTIREGTYWIATGALKDCSQITELYIPESVRYYPASNLLGSYSSLTKLSLPYLSTGLGKLFTTTSYSNSTAVAISSSSFSTYYYIPSSLRSVTIHGGYIASEAFVKCMMLTNITLGDDVYGIGQRAFEQCTGLTSIVIPDNVSSISSWAFIDCRNLTNVTLGKNIKTIASGAFGYTERTPSYSYDAGYVMYANCANLTIYFRGTIEDYCNISFGCALADTKTVYVNGSLLVDVVIPNTVTKISSYAFMNAITIKTLTLSDSITSIGDYAFYNCNSIESINLGNSIKSIGKQAFYNCTSAQSITFGNRISSIGESAFANCSAVKSIILPESVTSIGAEAFNGCSSLESITLPFVGGSRKTPSSTYQYPLGYIFGTTEYEGGTAIKQTYIGSNTSKTTSSTYYIPTTLTDITILSGHLLRGSLHGCSQIVNLTIGEGVETIEANAFNMYSSKLTNVYYTGDLSGWFNIAIARGYDNPLHFAPNFYVNNLLIENLTIPSDIVNVGEFAFYGYAGLKSIHIHKDVISIAQTAFQSCDNIQGFTVDSANTIFIAQDGILYDNVQKDIIIVPKLISGKITILDGVSIIKYGFFNGITTITEIFVPGSVKEIEGDAFYDCEGLEIIRLQEGVEIIGGRCFSGCVNLKEFHMPKSIKQIGWATYYNADEFDVYYYGDINSWLQIVFEEDRANPAAYAKNFYFNGSKLTELIIPEGTTTINSYAFNGFTDVTKIVLPASITQTGYGSFRFVEADVYYGGTLEQWMNIDFGYTNYASVTLRRYDGNPIYYGKKLYINNELVTNVTVPESITYVKGGVFCGYEYLQSITFHNNIERIGDSAFFECNGLTNIVIPDSVVSIYANAFTECANIETITIGSGLKTLQSGTNGSKPFYGLPKLNKFIVSSENQYFSEQDGILYNKDKTEIIQVPYGVTSVIIPTSITHIPDSCFASCRYLKTVSIPTSVKTIGNSAFSGCISLTTLVIPDSVTSIGDDLVSSCFNLVTMTIGRNVTSIGSEAFSSDAFIFSNCFSITEVYNKSSLNITAANFGNRVDNIYTPSSGSSKIIIDENGYVFYRYSSSYALVGYFGNDTDLVLPDYVNNSTYHIASHAFYSNPYITGITIPSTVTGIYNEAFAGCENLVKITVAEGNAIYHSSGNCLIKTADKKVVLGCKTSVIPNDGSVTIIGEYAFYSCDIVSIVIPESVTIIEDAAFEFCEKLETIYIPDTIEYVGNMAFYSYYKSFVYNEKDGLLYFGNENNPYLVLVEIVEEYDDDLISVSIAEGCKIITGQPFSSCWNLSNVVIPEGVTFIGTYTFNYCSSLTTLTLPNSIECLESYAFAGCNNLKSISYNGTIEEWNDVVKESGWNNNITEVICSNGTVTL